MTRSPGAHAAAPTNTQHFIRARPLLRRPGGYGEGINTRSHPELGRENPQRQWYCVLRRGRVGRRQVFPAEADAQRPQKAFQSTCQRTETTGQPRPAARHAAHGPPVSVRRPPIVAGWSSPVARQAHNLKVIGSNPIPATTLPCAASPAVERPPGLCFLPSAKVSAKRSAHPTCHCWSQPAMVPVQYDSSQLKRGLAGSYRRFWPPSTTTV